MATANEHLVTAGGVALLGLAGLGVLGVAARDAISGDATGGVPAWARSAGHPGASFGAVVATEAGLAAAIDDAAEVTRGLYRALPSKMEPFARSVSGGIDASSLRRFIVEELPGVGEALTNENVVRAVGPASTLRVAEDSAQTTLLRDLLVEAARHGAAGRLDLAGSADVLANRLLRGLGAYKTNDWLKTAAASGIPDDFAERLAVLHELTKGGLTPSRRAALFDPAGTRALELVTEPFEGPKMSRAEFELEYRGDPARALAALPERTRQYVESEVLPILKGELADDEAAQTELLAAIVTGSRGRVTELLGDTQTDAPHRELAEYAVTLFPDFAESFGPLRKFSVEEAEALIRFPGADEAALLAREEGGDAMWRLLQAVDSSELEALPGRPAEVRARVVEEWLRAVARGHLEAASDFDAALSHVYRAVPLELRELVESVLARFAKEA